MAKIEFSAENSARLDKIIAENTELSRSYAVKLIESGFVTVDGKAADKKDAVKVGAAVSIEIPEAEQTEILPENIPLDIVYEDEDLLVVNKPKGMVVHPAAGHYTGTLVNALMYHCRDNLSGINGVTRPGIVHRIDMNTTGVLVACKNDAAHIFLSEQLAVHSITRKYNAIVHNSFKENSGTVDAPIGRHHIDRKKMAIDYKNGRNAVTHYSVISNYGKYAHIECQLETGRTHQIRVHMSSIGHPLLGDDVYGSGKSPYRLEGQTLHARVLGFVHPSTGKYMEFEAPLPDYFKEIIVDLENKCK